MDSLKDLFEGLKMLQKGISDYHIGTAIADTNDQVNKLSDDVAAGNKTYQEERAARTKLTNNLMMNLAAADASGEQIKTAFQAVAPQTLNSLADIQTAQALAPKNSAAFAGLKQMGDQLAATEQAQAQKNSDMLVNAKIKEQTSENAQKGATELKKVGMEVKGRMDVAKLGYGGADAPDMVAPGIYSIPGAKLSPDQKTKASHFYGVQKDLIGKGEDYLDALGKGTKYLSSPEFAKLQTKYASFFQGIFVKKLDGSSRYPIEAVKLAHEMVGQDPTSLSSNIAFWQSKNRIPALKELVQGLKNETNTRMYNEFLSAPRDADGKAMIPDSAGSTVASKFSNRKTLNFGSKNPIDPTPTTGSHASYLKLNTINDLKNRD